MNKLISAILVIVATAPLTTIAQNSPQQFDVTSVKPNNSGSGSAINGVRGERFFSTNVTLTQLIRAAYNVQEFQIAGQPGWFNSQRFDIEARLAPNTKTEDWPQMLQALLADRFKLALHRESREVSIFALVVARNGHKLLRGDPTKCDRSNPGNECGGFRASPSEIIGTQVSMEQLATRLSRSLGRMVIDKTELKGDFDLKVTWTPDENVPLGPGASASFAIFAAIQDHLGLRLESTKGPVETLVIDRAERPSEN